MNERRLIDADALKSKLKIDTNTATYSDYCNGYCDARQVDLDAIDAAPTIEADPVMRGEGCEYCKGTSYTKEPFKVITQTKHCVQVCFNFCPYCGKRMKGGADNA